MSELLGRRLAAGQGTTLLKNKVVDLLYYKYVVKAVVEKRQSGLKLPLFFMVFWINVSKGVRKGNACTFFYEE